MVVKNRHIEALSLAGSQKSRQQGFCQVRGLVQSGQSPALSHP